MLLATTASQRLDKNYPTLHTVGALMNCILDLSAAKKLAGVQHGRQVFSASVACPHGAKILAPQSKQACAFSSPAQNRRSGSQILPFFAFIALGQRPHPSLTTCRGSVLAPRYPAAFRHLVQAIRRSRVQDRLAASFARLSGWNGSWKIRAAARPSFVCSVRLTCSKLCHVPVCK